MKRHNSTQQRPISPPATKRKLESTTTSKAVASFFKPASQKEPEKITWRVLNQSLVIGKHDDPAAPRISLQKPVRIVAFDLDDTIITPAVPGNKWVRSATSWRWWDPCVPGRLKELYNEGCLVVLFSNQSTISLKDDPKKLQKDKASLVNFKNQVTSIFQQLDIPISIYAATSHDKYRKPRVGMWEEMKEDYDLEAEGSIDMANSVYIGDAAGRERTEKKVQDHAVSDRDLAANIGIGFQTPEEFFTGAATEPYLRKFDPKEFLSSMKAASTPFIYSKTNTQDIVMFCGSPGAGKSSFYWKFLQPLGYERVNQDILKSRDRCLRTARDYLKSGSSVAVDNTNRDDETRAHWIKLAKEFNIPIRCVYFTAPARLCEHNDAFRSLNKELNPENRSCLPPIAFIDFARKFVEPKLEEGFQDITKLDFEFVGTDEQRQLWSKHWVSKFST